MYVSLQAWHWGLKLEQMNSKSLDMKIHKFIGRLTMVISRRAIRRSMIVD